MKFFRRGGDLFHESCLTEALLEGAEEIDSANVEQDDVCGACDEALAPQSDDEEETSESLEEEEVPEDPKVVTTKEDGSENLTG